MSNPIPFPTGAPFKPEHPAKMAARVRTALTKVWTDAQADAFAALDADYVFDFAEGVRLILTVQAADDFAERGLAPQGARLLVVTGEAAPGGFHPPLEQRHMPLVMHLLRRIPYDGMQQNYLHGFYSAGRVHLTFTAPPEAGEPLPEPPPAPAPAEPQGDEAPKFRKPEPEGFEIEIPPGLRAGIGKATAKRIEP
jgi:hypothetical protein